MRRRSCYMLMAGVATLGVGCGTVLAFYKQLGQSLSVIIGYAVLLISSVLIGLFLTGVSGDAKRTVFLVVLVLLLVFVLGTITALLFSLGGSGSRDMGLSEALESGADTGSEDALIESDPGGGEEISGGPPDEEVNMDAVLPAISLIPTVEPASIPIEETEDSRAEADNPAPDTDGSISSINTSATDSIPNIELAPDSDASYSVDSVENHEDSVGFDESASDSSSVPDVPVSYTADTEESSMPSADGSVMVADPVDAIPEPEKSDAIESVSDLSEEEPAADAVAEDEGFFGYYDGARWENDDFWSTFYIAGEEDFVLADGLYYMSLEINNEPVGTIQTLIENGEGAIDSDEFRAYIESSVIEEVVDRIFSEGHEYLSLSYLNSIGIPASINTDDYVISITFSATDMPVQIISIRSTDGPVSRRPIAGATTLDPAVFYIASRYNLSTSFRIGEFDQFRNSLEFSFSSTNTLRLYDVYGTFSYYLTWGTDWFRFRFGSYKFYTDFQDEMIRLEWGNVNTELLSPPGTSFGVSFEKLLSYAAPGTRSRSHIDRMLIVEKESDVQILNEGREIFRRTLQPGTYRLQDFVLYTGANRIRIIVTPLDGSSLPEEIDIDINYSSSLLAPGEVYYGATLASGRKEVSSADSQIPGSVRIPVGNNNSLDYDLRNLVLSGFVNAGLSTTLTMDLAMALQNTADERSWFNPAMATALELTHANILGTTRYSFRVTERTEAGSFVIPDLYGRIGHQITLSNQYLSSVNFSATYSGDITDNTLSGSIGLSGKLGFMNCGLTGYISSDLVDVDGLSWTTTLSASMSLGRQVWLSGSLDLAGSGANAPSVSGRVSATVRFGGGSANASYSNTQSSISANVYDSKNKFSARLTTDDVGNINAYGVDAEYTYDGKFINATASLDAADLFMDTRASFSVSTSTLFADGLFTVASSIPSNFLLVSQQGTLKNNTLSVGSAGSSSTTNLRNVFGSYLYSGLSTMRDTSLSLYSYAESTFSSSEVFDITIPAGPRRGYVLRLNADPTFTVSGVVYVDGVLWTNASSPVYSVSIDENGEYIYSQTEYYLFSDSDGRFILSGLYPGDYAFDVQSSEGWLSYTFHVDDDEESASLIHLIGNESIDDIDIGDPYAGVVRFENIGAITADEFWLMLYPEMEVAV